MHGGLIMASHKRFVPTQYGQYPTVTEQNAGLHYGAFRVDGSGASVYIPAGTVKIIGVFGWDTTNGSVPLATSGITVVGLQDTITGADLAAESLGAATLGASDSSGTPQWSLAADKTVPTLVTLKGLKLNAAAGVVGGVIYSLG